VGNSTTSAKLKRVERDEPGDRAQELKG